MIIFSERYLEHRQSSDSHPESPERLRSILSEMEAYGMGELICEPRSGFGEGPLMYVHDPVFVDAIRNFGEGFYDPDTYVRQDTFDIALISTWGALTAVEHAVGGEAGFALTRPPGHHAGVEHAGGFCYFNNVAIAAEHAIRTRHIQKVAIVDLDVHHGNGTEEVFRSRSDVLYISIHQLGIYPGTGSVGYAGEGPGAGYTVNVPLPAGSGDATFREAVGRVVIPILERFAPGLLLVSYGVDAHYCDPIASLTLSSSGYLELTREMVAFARGKGVPFAFMLEGGYDPSALAESVRASCALIHGREPGPLRHTRLHDVEGVGRANVSRALDVQRRHWNIGRGPEAPPGI